jgi:AmiR/NasT family two-component response regulator
MTEAKKTVLVVDDDRLVLATLASGLKSAGFDIIEADNGDDAILLARQHRPDLALLDMRMQGKSGMDVAGYLRDHTGTPFMFLSAFGDADIVQQAAQFGALAYLVKPLDIRQIVPAVKAALARAEEIRALREAQTLSSGAEAGAASETVGVAIGIVMQRFALSRVEAGRRLAETAAREQLSPEQVAQQIIEAAEGLNRLGPSG